MARKSNYHRSFIILKPESKGYGLKPNKEPAGYCKFEIRRGIGKAYIYLQDMKPSSALDGTYEAYLISIDDSIKPCKLASLHIDDHGRGEHVASFDANDIMGSGKSLENFHALAITFRSQQEDKAIKVAYPLIGYSSRDVNINSHIITDKLKAIHGEEVELQIHPEPEVELEEQLGEQLEEQLGEQLEEQVKEEYLEDLESDISVESVTESVPQVQDEPVQDTKVEWDPGLETEELVDDSQELKMDNEKLESREAESQEIPEQEAVNYATQAIETKNEEEPIRQQEFYGSADDLKKAYEDSYRGYLKDFAYQDKYYPYRSGTYWDSVKDYFTGLFKAYQRVYPFGNDLKDAEWVRVQQAVPNPGLYYGDSIYRYPYYGSHYPDHYIVGLIRENEEVKYVVYGIPSMYSMIPPVSITGFSRWVPVKDGYGLGYWLLYIDAISGRVIYPYERGMI
ncbi:MAG: hypothetical protein WAP19_06305 [Caldicoprobacterales bacterium]